MACFETIDGVCTSTPHDRFSVPFKTLHRSAALRSVLHNVHDGSLTSGQTTNQTLAFAFQNCHFAMTATPGGLGLYPIAVSQTLALFGISAVSGDAYDETAQNRAINASDPANDGSREDR